MLIYRALAMCVIIKTLAGEMHIQEAKALTAVSNNIVQKTSINASLAAASITIGEEYQREFDCCILCYLLILLKEC